VNPRNYEELSRADLIRDLEQRDAEHAHIVHDLEVHQAELEMQNQELRETHERLAEASEKYRELYEFAPIGYCTLDPEGRIADINLRAAQILGAPRDELIGRSFAARLPRESRPRFAEHVARCRRERAAVTSELAIAADGVRKQTVQMVSEPVFNDGGAAIAFRTSFVDISPLKALERDLVLLSRAGEALAAALDSGSTQAIVARLAVPALADICMLDLVGEAGRLERALVEVDDQGSAALVARLRSLENLPGWKSPQRRVIESGEPMLLERVPERDRTRIGQDDREAALLRDAGIRSLMIVPLSARGHVLGALTLAVGKSARTFDTHDLELARGVASRAAMALDNVRLYEQAREASAARDATLAVVAHDLRSPLQTILLYSSLLQDKAGLPPPATVGATIVRAARQMNRLIRDLVDVSSIEAGRFSVETHRYSLAEIVRASVEALRPMAVSKSIALTAELGNGDRLDVACDPDRIEQVLGNLIGNAIKFTPASGRIVVRVERRGDEVRVAVADNGPGIASALLRHVFDRYWQAPETARQGHGLGLAIAKGIIEAHDGRIWVDSEVGKGTTFHFALPAALHDRAPSGELAAQPASGKTILVVEDDPDLRDVICQRLEHAGYGVVKKSDGAEALAYLHQVAPPSLILLDLTMPVMDGWEFLTEWDRDPALHAIPVLVLSGERDVAERLSAFHVAAIAKPVAAEQLIRAVGFALARAEVTAPASP
jgi:PAS domain S-box-containing protein